MLTGNVSQILTLLRSLMLTSIEHVELSAYIVPTADSHHSEYVSTCHRRLSFITGFTGSSGTALVTVDKALLWTDSRYYIQAGQQLNGTEWILMKSEDNKLPTLSVWLTMNLRAGAAVGIDPWLFPKTEWDALESVLKSYGIRLIPTSENLVDKVWGDERPPCSQNQVFPLPLEFAGKNVTSKLQEIRREMRDNAVSILVVSELDEVPWLLNLRGDDIQYNPFFFAYMIVTNSSFQLFIEPSKLNWEIRENLRNVGGEVYPYEELLDRLAKHVNSTSGKVWLSKNINYKIASQIDSSRLILRLTPIAFLKAVKNDVEVKGLVNAHIRDGAAFVEFFAWLDNQMDNGILVTELTAAKQLESFRKTKEFFKGLSYYPISASGAHAAMPHYAPTATSDVPLKASEVYLIDSGGQYLDGTIDTTRTVHFGMPTPEIIDAFTRVLKGSIALRTTIFPRKTVGSALDTLARKYLWDVKLNYGHGTGHGIGSYLGVHEGPFSIGRRTGADDPGLDENMFMSNEPGFYKEGEFGIRIENVIRVVNATLDKSFLMFEDVTLVPIQQKLINKTMLTSREILYVNTYHEKVRMIVGAYLNSSGASKMTTDWLENATRAI